MTHPNHQVCHDPAVREFLDFLAADIERHPDRLTALDSQFAGRLQALVGQVSLDLDARLPDDE